MSPEEWKRIRAVFDEAVELPAEERTAFLAGACADDAPLRLAVESLLRADGRTRAELDRPGWVEPATEEQPDALLGARLGDYELVSVVGQGGMGIVYQAVRADDQFRKQVAVKLIKRGMDSALVVRRFKHEREILASLDHPNIARLLDAGTAPDGRPYFVMDYVEGQTLGQHCAQERVDLRTRLQVFRQVCAAVAYAHQRLVVHRDLKPGNILMTPDGTPKLLDFGISKVLDPSTSTESTATGLRLATPEYASPEQLRGERVTTATDVYSLGVVLYELLTGSKPYTFKSRHADELERVVSSSEPERPSVAVARAAAETGRRPPGSARELRRALAGDLDNIVLMALRKEPERRYASVEQLSEDLSRHLARRPVRARADTFRYRTGRLIARNRLASALLLLLVGGLATATYQARVASNERARAERRFAEVRGLATSLLFDFHDAIHDLPGSIKARELVLKKALESLDGLAQEAQGDPGLQRELGLAYVRLAELEGGTGVANLGARREALAHLEKAVGLLAQAYAVRADPLLAGDLADAHKALAQALSGQLRPAEAEREVQEARRLAERAASAGRLEDVLRQASLERLQSELFSNRSAWDLAIERLRAALALLRKLPGGSAALPEVRRQRLHTEVRLGDALGQLGRPDASLEVLEATAAGLEPQGLPQAASERRVLALVQSMAGSALLDLERPAEAARRFARGREVLEGLCQADPQNFQSQRDLILTTGFQCTAESEAGRRGEAREACSVSLRMAEKLVRDHRAEPGALEALAFTLDHNARLARAEGRLAEALAFYRHVADSNPPDTDAWHRRAEASAHTGLAQVLEDMGRAADALEEARTAVQLLELARHDMPQEPSVLKELASAQARLGRLLAGGGDGRAEARGLLVSALATFEALDRQGMTIPEVPREVQQLRKDLATLLPGASARTSGS